MIFKCKSGSSPHCDCIQSITVQKVDAFLELKIFKNNCSTMLRMHFQSIKQCHMTIQLLLVRALRDKKIGPVRIVCRFMLTYIKTFNGV